MDKKYVVIGILCILAAFALMFKQAQDAQRTAEEHPADQPATEEQSAEEAAPVEVTESSDQAQDLFPTVQPATEEEAAESPAASIIGEVEEQVRETVTAKPDERIYSLENDLIRVDFTNYGGGIKQVALKDYPAVQGEEAPYIFNEGSKLPALGISLAGADDSVEEYAPPYRMVKQDETTVEFSLEVSPGVEIIRSYEITKDTEGAAPYVIKHSTRFVNRTPTIFRINQLFVNVGTAPPTDSDPSGLLLNFGYYDGEDYEYEGVREFGPGGFMGMFKREPRDIIKLQGKTVWAAAKNQFFTSIVTPEVPGVGTFTQPVDFPQRETDRKPRQGITGGIEFDLEQVSARSERTLNMELYVGPKEFARLSKLEHRQELVMQLGFFGFIGKILLFLLLGLHNMLGNYGVAIILMTLCIRLLLWPLTAKAAQSSKKMQKIQEPLKELKERYKDQPEKLQQATMELFKEHRVNPAAGCLPIFIQIPIFFALFRMLRSASELRFAEFLWIKDLSLPDTIAVLGGVPLNPLPLVMGVTMHFQMKMTPMNMDSSQQKIFRMLPWIFLIFCYNFSSGLVLYWTMSNCFTIFQQYVTNRRNDSEEPARAVVSPAGPGGAAKKTKKRLKKPPKK